MEWDLQKVVANICQADTDDLIDRITAYRAGLESEAIEMIENELQRRSVSEAEIQVYRQQCQTECLFHTDGTAKMCSFCRKPAVTEKWGWHRLLDKIPLLPRRMRYCKEHQTRETASEPR